MDSSAKLQTIDIPQADSLPTIRRVVEAISAGCCTNSQIATMTGFSDRHVRYRFQAARILRFVDSSHVLTQSGRRLLETMPGSDEEQRELRSAVEDTVVVRIIIPDLLSTQSIDKEKISMEIARLTGLSIATARRRAQVLKSWARQLSRM